MEAFVLIKYLDDQGDPQLGLPNNDRLNRQELLGALVVHVAVLKKELRDEWENDDD